MLYKSSFETAAQSEMVAALFELYLALMRDVKKGVFYSVKTIVTNQESHNYNRTSVSDPHQNDADPDPDPWIRI